MDTGERGKLRVDAQGNGLHGGAFVTCKLRVTGAPTTYMPSLYRHLHLCGAAPAPAHPRKPARAVPYCPPCRTQLSYCNDLKIDFKVKKAAEQIAINAKPQVGPVPDVALEPGATQDARGT